jgi:hypothetical protein
MKHTISIFDDLPSLKGIGMTTKKWRYRIEWFDKKYNRWRESICIPGFDGDEEKALTVAMRNFDMEVEDGRDAHLIDNYTGKVIHSNCEPIFRNHSAMSEITKSCA